MPEGGSGTIFRKGIRDGSCRRRAEGGTYGAGAPPGIDHRNCRSRVALAQCVLGCRKSDPEGPVEGTPEALRRRRRAARRNRPPTGSQSAGEVATGWYRRLVARKFDGSRTRRAPGSPPIGRDIEDLIVRMAAKSATSTRSCRNGPTVSIATRTRSPLDSIHQFANDVLGCGHLRGLPKRCSAARRRASKRRDKQS